MSAVLSAVPWSWRIAIAAVVLVFCGGAYGAGVLQGYAAGHEAAANKGNAALAEFQADHAQVFAEATSHLMEKLQRQTQTALAATKTLDEERQSHAETETALRKEIARVTRNSKHTFSADFVRVWNQSTGASVAGSGSPTATGHPTGAAGTAQAGKAAGAGVRRGAVTEADVLAHIVYYGKRARDLESQVNAWIDTAQGAGWHESR